MKLSNLCVGTAIAFASAGASAVNLGTLDLSSGSNNFGNTPIAGSFTDTISFTLATNSLFNASFTTIVNGTQNVNFTSIVVTPGAFALAQLLPDPVEVWGNSVAFNLAPGTYTITMMGNNSPSMGSYGANVAVSPVPEAESYAMLLAGLGVVGLMLRRRQS